MPEALDLPLKILAELAYKALIRSPRMGIARTPRMLRGHECNTNMLKVKMKVKSITKYRSSRSGSSGGLDIDLDSMHSKSHLY